MVMDPKLLAPVERAFERSRDEFVKITAETIYLDLFGKMREKGTVQYEPSRWETFPAEKRRLLESIAGKIYDDFKPEASICIADAFETFMLAIESMFESFLNRLDTDFPAFMSMP